ncbi:MAG: hypothetical protein Q9195_008396 [Heterodermia aff. obscurata]
MLCSRSNDDQEHNGAAEVPGESVRDSFQILHRLSQKFHVLHANLDDFEETLNFILATHQQCCADDFSGDEPATNIDSMEFLLSRNRIWKRWVAHYITRTTIRIDLFFNIANQNDNRINIDIASTSKRIAEEAKRDSSSMITIAAMTMLFLPGTFVSVSTLVPNVPELCSSIRLTERVQAIFGTTFFDTTVDEKGKTVLQVLPEWWFFLAATIPLTAMIFAFWIWWQKQRNAKGGQNPNQPSTNTMMEMAKQQRYENHALQTFHPSIVRKRMHY